MSPQHTPTHKVPQPKSSEEQHAGKSTRESELSPPSLTQSRNPSFDSQASESSDEDKPLVHASATIRLSPKSSLVHLCTFWNHKFEEWDKDRDYSEELDPLSDARLRRALNQSMVNVCSDDGGCFERVCGFYRAPYAYALHNHAAVMKRIEEEEQCRENEARREDEDEKIEFFLLHEPPKNLIERIGDWCAGGVRLCITEESLKELKRCGICFAPKLYGMDYGGQRNDA